jgi:AbrB family looped-hinge helix DNA binding protein
MSRVRLSSKVRTIKLSITNIISINGDLTLVEVVSVTKKGQATIPKRLRKKYGITNKIIFEENEKGIIIKPVPSPRDEFGSLKGALKGKTARELLEEARKEECAQDQEWIKRAKSANV